MPRHKTQGFDGARRVRKKSPRAKEKNQIENVQVERPVENVQVERPVLHYNPMHSEIYNIMSKMKQNPEPEEDNPFESNPLDLSTGSEAQLAGIVSHLKKGDS
ncbi:MAG: hypothetical protein AAF443_07620 [Chlamydiota bacterium]